MGGGQPGTAGTPGSGVDNYSTETQVDASANGQGQMSNMYVIDGLDVTSGIRQGVLNLTPNPESIQETSIQVNTYSAEYTRASGVEEVMTTKSGSEQFHGSVGRLVLLPRDVRQNSFLRSEIPAFPRQQHIGRDRRSGHPAQTVFISSSRLSRCAHRWRPTRRSRFADPAVHRMGESELSQYRWNKRAQQLPADERNRRRRSTATGSSVFPAACGTAATNNLPCSLPLIDTGNFSAPQVRNGTQYFVRIDKSCSRTTRSTAASIGRC